MGKSRGEGSNKAARIAQSEQAQREKQEALENDLEEEEASKWGSGSKKGGKREEQAAKRAEQLRKKAENERLLREEEESTPGRNQPRKTKQAQKKGRGLDVSQLDDDDEGGDDDVNSKLPTINVTGVEDAIDALGVDDGSFKYAKVDRHPERRFGPALAAYQEMRLEQMKSDGSGAGLRLYQRKALIAREFEKHPDNPYTQLTADFDATKEEIKRIRDENVARIKSRLAEKEDDEEE